MENLVNHKYRDISLLSIVVIKKVDLWMTWMKMMMTLATIIVKAETRTNATRMRMTTMTMMKPPAMKICMHCSFSHSLGIGEQLCRLSICINS